MEDENALEGLVHHSLDESPGGLETLIEQHKSAVERFDLLGWPRPEVTVVSGSGLGVDLGERTHGPVQLDFLLPFPTGPRGTTPPSSCGSRCRAATSSITGAVSTPTRATAPTTRSSPSASPP